MIWARGDLPASFAGTVRSLPEVVSSAHVPSETLGLVGSRGAGGRTVESYADGFMVPVAVAALDPRSYAATLTDDVDRAAVSRLRPGGVLLSETGARLRGIGRGGRIDLATRAGLQVLGVVADSLAGGAELLAHADDADSLGLGADGTVFLRHRARRGRATQRLVETVAGLVPSGLTARVVDVGGGRERRRAARVLSLPQVKAQFGEFAFRPRGGEREIDLAPGFVDPHIVDASVPLLGTVRCHRGIVADLRGALRDVVSAGLGGEIDPARYAGCFYPRTIAAGTAQLSRHSWGIALDINVDLSVEGGGERPHPRIIAAFERHGFRWGGHFIVPDNHHFEWVGEEVSG